MTARDTTPHRVPAPGIRVDDGPGNLAWHGAIGGLEVHARIGHALGSQASAGIVADVTVSRGPDGGIAYGVTTTDPAALEEAGRTLLAAAHWLRQAKIDAEASR